MRKMIFFGWSLIFILFSAHGFGGDLVITVDRFTQGDNKAPIRFSLCNNKECHEKRDKGYVDIDAQLIEFTEQSRKYRIKNIKPGEYSLSAYHDLNNTGELERSGMLGIPKEPIGFSRLDVQKIRRHPKWEEVKFHVGKGETFIMVHLVNKFGL